MISSKLSKESERLIGDFIFIFYFCGVLAEADVKNPARGHKVVKHHPEGKNVRYTLLCSSKYPAPAAFPAGVDPNRGSEETVRSPGETVRSPGVL